MKSGGASIPIVPLSRQFYARDPRKVARELLGKVLVRVSESGLLTGRIVETEAYLGKNDAAAHSAAGNTPRNAVLWGPPGYAYVYFIYGNHYCLNVSCEPDGKAGGVLFRALEPLTGLDEMTRNRGFAIEPHPYSPAELVRLTSGPGRLAEAFAITRVRDNGVDLTSAGGDLWIGDDGDRPRKILRTPRIGITKSADELLRFVVAGNRFISGRR